MPEYVELHCEVGDHDWKRLKQRGARPKNCPEHQAELDAVKQAERIERLQERTQPEVDPELVAAKAFESGLPKIVVTAFLANDSELPERSRVDHIGYTATEMGMIEPLLSSPTKYDKPEDEEDV